MGLSGSCRRRPDRPPGRRHPRNSFCGKLAKERKKDMLYLTSDASRTTRYDNELSRAAA